MAHLLLPMDFYRRKLSDNSLRGSVFRTFPRLTHTSFYSING